jgi:hypothetical protein
MFGSLTTRNVQQGTYAFLICCHLSRVPRVAECELCCTYSEGRPFVIMRPHSFYLLACWFLAELICSTLKVEAICSSETSVDTQRTTRRHIPEDDTLQADR